MTSSKNLSRGTRRIVSFKLLGAVAALALCAGLAAPTFAQGKGSPGAVFVGTNRNNTHPSTPPGTPANQVAMYSRAADGSLSLIGYFDTGGQGSGPAIRFAGDGLGSAHSVQLSEDRRFLFVTNAGSDNVTVFRVSKSGLERTDLEPTLDFPNSVTQHGDLVYVLTNNGGVGGIQGYRLSNHGTLTPIPGSTRTLAANQDPVRPDTLLNPTQVSFTPDGRQLVVTIKDGPTLAAVIEAGAVIPNFTGPTGPGRVQVFDVGRDGRPSATYTQTNLNNTGPFGFSFDRHGNILIALFIGGPQLTGAAGSWQIADNGSLIPITPLVLNFRLDTCWLENNGRYAYGANYTSGDISSYTIGSDGSLTLLEAVAGTTEHGPLRQGSTPLDIRVSPNGKFLYDVLPGTGKVAAWRINADGSLTKIGEYGGLPVTIDGDVAMCDTPSGPVPCEFGPGGSPAGIDVL